MEKYDAIKCCNKGMRLITRDYGGINYYYLFQCDECKKIAVVKEKELHV